MGCNNTSPFKFECSFESDSAISGFLVKVFTKLLWWQWAMIPKCPLHESLKGQGSRVHVVFFFSTADTCLSVFRQVRVPISVQKDINRRNRHFKVLVLVNTGFAKQARELP